MFGSQIRYTVDEKEQQQLRHQSVLNNKLTSCFLRSPCIQPEALGVDCSQTFHKFGYAITHYFLPVEVLGTGGCGTSGNGFINIPMDGGVVSMDRNGHCQDGSWMLGNPEN